MSPMINSSLSVLFLLLGAGAVAIMLELKGNPKDRFINTRLVWAHRLLGYGFVALFVFMLFVMIRKAGTYQQELAVRSVLHVALGLLLVPLVAVKIYIARRQKALTRHLTLLGVALFSIAFVLSGLTAGHYLLHQSDPRYITVSDIDKPVLNTEIGRAVLFDKCGKCHTFERIFRSTKDQEGWTRTINRMAVIDAPNINDFDIKQIIFFLLDQQKQREEKLGRKRSRQIGQTLVSRKCSMCHNLDRVFKASKSKDQWQQTVRKMMAYSGDPKFLSTREIEEIITFLSERNASTAAAD